MHIEDRHVVSNILPRNDHRLILLGSLKDKNVSSRPKQIHPVRNKSLLKTVNRWFPSSSSLQFWLHCKTLSTVTKYVNLILLNSSYGERSVESFWEQIVTVTFGVILDFMKFMTDLYFSMVIKVKADTTWSLLRKILSWKCWAFCYVRPSAHHTTFAHCNSTQLTCCQNCVLKFVWITNSDWWF